MRELADKYPFTTPERARMFLEGQYLCWYEFCEDYIAKHGKAWAGSTHELIEWAGY